MFEWAGLDPDVMSIPLAALDLAPEDHYRAFVMFEHEEMPLADLGLTVGQWMKTHHALRGARVAAGVQLTTAEEKQKAVQPPASAPTTCPHSPLSIATPSLEAPDTVKLGQVLCQRQPGEVKFMTRQDYANAHQRCKDVVSDPRDLARSPPESN